MASTVKIAALSATGLALLGAAWVGASHEAGRRAETELNALVAQLGAGHTGVRIKNLKHERSLLSSAGTMEVQFEDSCDADGSTPEASFAVQVDYRMSHLLTPTSAVRFDWGLRPAGEAGELFAKALGGTTRLEGSGSVDFHGNLHSSMSLPELTVNGGDGQRLQVSPSTGRVAWGATAMGLEWNTDKITARGNGTAVEVNKLALAIDLRNRYRGTGTMSLGVDKVSTSLGNLEGLKLASDVTEHGDRLDMKFSQALRSTSIAGKDAKNLSFELGVKDVHAASLETISRIVGDTCGLQNMTADEDTRLRAALRTLLAQGFAIGVPKVAGTVGDGSLDGSLSIELKPTPGGTNAPVRLAQLLRSSGKLSLQGSALSAEQKQMAVAMGFAVVTATGLEASYEYTDGIFKANGRVFDAGMVQTALSGADTEINRFLTTPRLAEAQPAPEAAPVAAPVAAEAAVAAAALAPVETPLAAPILAAAPASAGDCDTVANCVGLTLRAAAREDVDTLRAVATRIDALPKPDLGNKAMARKFNNEGLDALRREDHAAAIDAFRRGLQENPRDVELAGNLGFAQLRFGHSAEAVASLTQAVVLDPRRTSTWTPLAEALAMNGRKDEALAALWVSFQWSGNRDKSLAYYAERADTERALRPPVAELYAAMSQWANGGHRPVLASLASR